MAKEKVAGLMSTEIGLDTAKATESLNQRYHQIVSAGTPFASTHLLSP